MMSFFKNTLKPAVRKNSIITHLSCLTRFTNFKCSHNRLKIVARCSSMRKTVEILEGGGILECSQLRFSLITETQREEKEI